MGGDFFLEYISIEKDKEPDWTKAREVVEKMGRVHISKWKDTFDHDFTELFERYYEEALSYEDEIQPDMNDRIKICENLIACLREIRASWDNGTRDSIVIELRGRNYLFTGGMSWGDAPTELYDQIGKLLCTKLIQAAGFEDH